MASTVKSRAGELLALDEKALIAQCDVDHYRSHGPGGQKKNKTSSAVRLRHRPTGLIATATEERSQHVNKVRAIRRMREAIALNVRTTVDLDSYSVSELLSSCLARDGHFRVGRRDVRYYPAISEVLDVLAACEMRVRTAAKHMGVSTAALVKFIRADRHLWERVNRMRSTAGVSPLK